MFMPPQFPFVLATFALIVAALAPTPSAAQSVAELKALALHHPAPDYPLSARRQRLAGRGVVVGTVDRKTGSTTSVRMEKSTGHKTLDDAVLRAFRQWRFKPGAVREFRAPVSYTMVPPPR